MTTSFYHDIEKVVVSPADDCEGHIRIVLQAETECGDIINHEIRVMAREGFRLDTRSQAINAERDEVTEC